MLFNSIEFVLFLPIVFLLYWFVFDYALRGCKRQLWWQNLFVLVASYVFYGWWDWKFLLLIALTTLCSYGSGLLIVKACERQNPTGGGQFFAKDKPPLHTVSPLLAVGECVAELGYLRGFQVL